MQQNSNYSLNETIHSSQQILASSEDNDSQQSFYPVENDPIFQKFSLGNGQLPRDKENPTISFRARSIFELENSRTKDRIFRVKKLSGGCCMYILSGHSLEIVNILEMFLNNHEEIFVKYYIDRINVSNVYTGEPLMFFHVKYINQEKKFVSAMKKFIRREAKKPNYQKMVFVQIQKILQFPKDNELEAEKRLEEQGQCQTEIQAQDKWIKFKSLYVAGSFAAMLSCPFKADRQQYRASQLPSEEEINLQVFRFSRKESDKIEGYREDEIKQVIQELEGQQQKSLQVPFPYHPEDDQEGHYETLFAKGFKEKEEEYKVVKLSDLDVSWQT